MLLFVGQEMELKWYQQAINIPLFYHKTCAAGVYHHCGSHWNYDDYNWYDNSYWYDDNDDDDDWYYDDDGDWYYNDDIFVLITALPFFFAFTFPVNLLTEATRLLIE